MDPGEFDRLPEKNYSTGFDYREETFVPTSPFPRKYSLHRSDSYDGRLVKHPNDCSLVTYRGHSVHRTLIRCHFSPPTSTGSRYLYTGSADGKVQIYNLDATIADTIDVNVATMNPRSIGKGSNSWRSNSDWEDGTRARKSCVRDVSWHPSAPVLASMLYSSTLLLFAPFLLYKEVFC